MFTSRKRAAAMVLAVVTLAGACSGGGGGNRVATLGGSNGSTTSSSSTGSKQDFEDAMLEFARCMRDHGVDMPDPTFDGSGGGALIQKTDGAGAAGGGTGPGNATFDAAQKACQPIMDKAQQNAPKPTAEEQARMRDQMLAFTQCMRDHGIDMPDPTFDSDGGVSIQASGPGPSQDSTNGSDSSSSNGPSTGVGPNADPKFQAAAQACQQEGNGGPMFGVNGASSK